MALPRTDGPDQGTQIDKVEELAPKTTFLRLRDEDPASAATPLGASTSSGNAPVLLHCQWNPKEPSSLAAAGTDALARVWTVTRATPPGGMPNGNADRPPSSHVNGADQPCYDLVEEGTQGNATTTALAWNWDGTAIAVATDYGYKASINIWSSSGAHLQRFEISEPPVIKLRWNPSDAAILAVGVENGSAVVTVFRAATSNGLSYHLRGHDLANWPLDVAWVSDTDFFVCGGDVLQRLHCTPTSIDLRSNFDTRADDNFTQVLFDWRSNLVATASDRGVLDLWSESGERRSIPAHSGAITAMAWQPLLQTNPPDDERERLIATGSDDCSILIWNARMPDVKPKCFLTMESPIVALAFTPDGAFVAGATCSRVLIWKVGEHAVPRASWSRTPHPAWLSPKANGESDEEDEHCLCWDATGQKLAYGVNSRVSRPRYIGSCVYVVSNECLQLAVIDWRAH
ncbi:WD40 repeat domain-containing protein [Candidatus Bathyarchaeota archaeon]|nr:WD40 repeat domain-containing protein [Candidatus Bathyarchaeota archaeon]